MNGPVTQAYLHKDHSGHWRTVYPEAIESLQELFYQAVDLMEPQPAQAEKLLKKIISACGDGHLEAILYLGLLLCDRKKPIEGNALIGKAYQLAKEAIPPEFILGYDHILWGHLDNRPLLRCFFLYATEFMKTGNYARALRELDFPFRAEPEDRMGVRYEVLQCHLRLGYWAEMLELTDQYAEDHSVDFKYGRLLVLLETGQEEEAGLQLAVAREAFPHVAAELIKSSHNFPYTEFKHAFYLEGNYPLGSQQEAYQYWSGTRNLWLKHLKWLTSRIQCL